MTPKPLTPARRAEILAQLALSPTQTPLNLSETLEEVMASEAWLLDELEKTRKYLSQFEFDEYGECHCCMQRRVHLNWCSWPLAQEGAK